MFSYKKCRLHEAFCNREQEWQNQFDFIADLAVANDIDFNPSRFKKPRRYIRGFRVFWHQSDAAGYIAEKILDRHRKGLHIFNPWSAAWLTIDECKIKQLPFFYVPIPGLNPDGLDKRKVFAYVFSSHRDYSLWISDESTVTVHAICKQCLHKWTHYPFVKIIAGEETNPDDTIVEVDESGKEHVKLRCPICGGEDIYKDGHVISSAVVRHQNMA